MSVASRWCLPECGISDTEGPQAGASTGLRIIGIDPGLRRTGFGLVEQQPDGRLQYIASGVIVSGEGTLAERLYRIHDGIVSLVREYHPQLAVCEIVFVNVNPRSTLLLGQARGAAIAALASCQLSVHEYSALQIKQSVVGYGHATKDQIRQMMQRLLELPGLPSSDAADALACALTHLQTAPFDARLRAVGATRGRASFRRR